MKSTFRRFATLAVAASAAISTVATIAPAISAQFGQKEVDQSKFVAIASPVRGGTAHQLLVLEQISSSRNCWSESGSAPTLIDPLLVNFDFTGICGRSTDSNGYSIRMNGDDLGLQYSLRIVRRDGDMMLVGAPSNRSNPTLLVGRTSGVTPEFAKINLEPGWRFTKRTFEDQTLGHVYLTYEGNSPVVLAPGSGNSGNPNPNPGNPGPVNPGPVNPNPTPIRFADISNDIYRTEIEQAVALGFVAGFYEDNTFRPQQSLTREQLVSMVLEGLDKLPDVNLNIPSQVTSKPYSDVDVSRWSAAKIQFAQQTGIVSGYQDGTFRPAQPVTRAELIAVLRKAAMYGQSLKGQSAQLEGKQPAFNFADTAEHWAASGITEMSTYCGVASPLNETGNAFSPDSAALRNYAAAATLRMLNCVAGGSLVNQTANQTVAQ